MEKLHILAVIVETDMEGENLKFLIEAAQNVSGISQIIIPDVLETIKFSSLEMYGLTDVNISVLASVGLDLITRRVQPVNLWLMTCMLGSSAIKSEILGICMN
jgi:hypothetical protein